MDILGKSSGFGSSQFIESARYRHALEAELAQTISSFRSVKSARVHLAIPKQSPFLRDKKHASASVFVDTYAGSRLSQDKVASIVHLVASSISNLDSENVTVVDNQGNLLTDGGGSHEFTEANRLLKYRDQVETMYADKITDILTPLLGMGKVRARVAAEIDFTSSEQTRESFNPDLPALRSEQTLEETRSNSSGGGAKGVPGALSNQPPAAGVTANAAASKEQSSSDNRKQATKNYELDKTISHTRHQPGRVSRLTVAVVVDDKANINAETKEVTRVPLDEKEIAKITALVKDAIGFSAERGDSVNVINSSFAQELPVEPLPAKSFYEEAWFWQVAKVIAGGIILLILIIGVISPTLRSLAVKPDRVFIGKDGKAVEYDPSNSQLAANDEDDATHYMSADERMKSMQQMAGNDPQRVARVVQSWVDN